MDFTWILLTCTNITQRRQALVACSHTPSTKGGGHARLRSPPLPPSPPTDIKCLLPLLFCPVVKPMYSSWLALFIIPSLCGYNYHPHRYHVITFWTRGSSGTLCVTFGNFDTLSSTWFFLFPALCLTELHVEQ